MQRSEQCKYAVHSAQCSVCSHQCAVQYPVCRHSILRTVCSMHYAVHMILVVVVVVVLVVAAAAMVVVLAAAVAAMVVLVVTVGTTRLANR